jgi:hypothetical protein
MDGIISIIDHNGLWLMIIAVVGITAWFKYRERELKVQQDMRVREMEHLQKMKELELERAKTRQTGQNA